MTESLELLKIEVTAKLNWLNFEIDRLSQNAIEHPQVLHNLLTITEEISDFIHLIEINSTLPNNYLYLEIIRQSKGLWFELDKAANYISALQRETDEDRLIRELIFDVVQKNGISIGDLLINLNSPFSCISYDPVPVITGYPWNAFTLIDNAAFFHEIGHIVFWMYSDIEILMTEIVVDFFSKYRKENSGIDNKRNEEINKVAENGKMYWNEYRLNELFADFYAAYISGPIYYETIINMALTDPNSPFELNLLDVHPPSGIRMEVCKMVCSEYWQKNKEFILLDEHFKKYTSNNKIPHETQIICSSDLINELVKWSVQFITDKIPETIRFKPSGPQKDALSDEIPSLVKLLYEGLVVKLQDSENYNNWEKKAIRKMLRFVNQP